MLIVALEPNRNAEEVKEEAEEVVLDLNGRFGYFLPFSFWFFLAREKSSALKRLYLFGSETEARQVGESGVPVRCPVSTDHERSLYFSSMLHARHGCGIGLTVRRRRDDEYSDSF